MFDLYPNDFVPYVAFYTTKRLQYPMLNEPVRWLHERKIKATTSVTDGRYFREENVRLADDEMFLGYFADGAVFAHLKPRVTDFRRHLIVIANSDVAFEFRMRWS